MKLYQGYKVEAVVFYSINDTLEYNPMQREAEPDEILFSKYVKINGKWYQESFDIGRKCFRLYETNQYAIDSLEKALTNEE